MDNRTELAIKFFGNSILAAIILIAACYIIVKITEHEENSFLIYIARTILIIGATLILGLFYAPQQISLGIAIVVLLFLLRYYSIPLGVSHLQYKIRLYKLKKIQEQNSFNKLKSIEENYNLDKKYEEKITHINHIHYIIKCKDTKKRDIIADELFSKIKNSKFTLPEPPPQNIHLYSLGKTEHNYQILVWVKQMFYSESVDEIEKIIKETAEVYTLAEIIEKKENVSRETPNNIEI